MTHCEAMAEQMSLYIDDQLTDAEKVDLEAHMEQCPSCARDFEELQQLMGEIKNFQEVELPEDFHRETMEKIREWKKSRRTVDFGKYAAAAAGVLVTLLLLSGVSAGLASLRTDGVQTATQSAAGSADMMALTVDEMPQQAADVVSETVNQSVFDENMDQDDVMYLEEGRMLIAADQSESLLLSDGSEPVYGAGTAGIDAGLDGRNTVKNYNISLRVEDINEALRVINSLDGYNTNAWSNLSGDMRTANVTRRVDAGQYEFIIETLQTLGEVTGQYESEEIIESQRLDTEARIRAKEEERQRLFDLLTHASTIDVMIMVEERLSYVNTDLDNLKTSQLNLNGRASKAVVTVDLYARQPVVDDDGAQGGQFAKRINQRFISSLNLTIRTMENIVVFMSEALLPMLIVLAVAMLVLLAVRRLAGRRKSDEDK